MLCLTSCAFAATLLPMAALAQDTADGIRSIVFPTRDLTFSIRDIVFAEQDIEGKAIALAIEETETEIRIILPADILFDFDKAEIEPQAAEALAQVAAVLRERPGQVRIEGHTDATGSEAYNLVLSQQRAKSVSRWLAEHEQIDVSELEVVGLGESDPAAPNRLEEGSDNPEGRRKNRRVEIVIAK
jgi:outer membrane protein OmpA-like peptidoglycan-associated protein